MLVSLFGIKKQGSANHTIGFYWLIIGHRSIKAKKRQPRVYSPHLGRIPERDESTVNPF